MRVLAKKTDNDSIRVSQRISQIDPSTQLILTTNPEEVVRLVHLNQVRLVVSGQIFRWRMNGHELAQAIKQYDPSILFVMWSQHSVKSPYIDAFIPDGVGSVDEVARLFAVYEPGMTIEELVTEARGYEL